MPDIKPIVFLLLLTGCGYMGCISQNNVFNDVVTIAVPTNPEEQKTGSGHVQYWHKVDFPYAGKQLTLNVVEKEPRFCAESEIDEIKIEIPYNNPLKQCESKEFKAKLSHPLLKGESVIFSLNPVREFTVTPEICRNQDEDIHVPNTKKCLEDHIGTIHLVNSSNKLSRKRGFANEWNLIEKGQESATIEDYIAASVLYESAEERITKPDKLEVKSGGDLCKTKYDVLKEAEGKLKQPQQNTGNDHAEKLEKEVYEINKKVREARTPYKDILDETAINTLCGKLCGFDDRAQSTSGSGAKTVSTTPCVAFRPVSQGNRTVIPFVTLDTNTFAPEQVSSSSNGFDIGNGEGSANLGKVEDLIKEGNSAGEPTLQSKLQVSPTSNPNDKKIKEVLPQVDAYLGLDTFYKVEREAKELVITIKNEANGATCPGGGSASGRSGGTSGDKMLAGSYSVGVLKDCSSHIENSLYYVFSEGYPSGNPGDQGTERLSFISGEISLDATLKKGELYFGVKDNGDGYSNNSGHFEIKIAAQKTPPKVFSHVASWTEDKVKSALYGRNNNDSVVRNMYRHISTRSSFNNMVNAMLILCIMVSSLYFFLGFSKASIFQLAIMVAKIIVVMYVLRPDSWSFFNDHLFNLFIEGPKTLIDVMTGGRGGNFEFMDMVLYRFSVTETWIQILALMFSGPVGLLSVILIVWAVVVLVQCLFEAIVIYLISILAIGLLLCLAPYFVICILFRRTKNIFDMWIKTLLQTGMQPVIIFSCVALLTNAINNVIYSVLNFEVCDTCVLDLDLLLFTLCLLKFPLPVGVIPVTPINDTIREVYNTGHMVLLGLPGPIFDVILLIILVRVAKDFVVSSGELCSVMFGSFTNLSDVGGKAVQSLLSVVGMDQNTAHMLESHRRQSELFDKGPGGGRYVRPMPGMGGVYSGGDSGAGNVRRRQIIAPHDPPASF